MMVEVAQVFPAIACPRCGAALTYHPQADDWYKTPGTPVPRIAAYDTLQCAGCALRIEVRAFKFTNNGHSACWHCTLIGHGNDGIAYELSGHLWTVRKER